MTSPQPTSDAPTAPFALSGAADAALRASGALWLQTERVLAVADLHLGRAERTARRGGPLLPPYDDAETLTRLEREIDALRPACVVCVGDSFDDDAAARALSPQARACLERVASGPEWIWIAGNHDPHPAIEFGASRTEHRVGGLQFRHIAASGFDRRDAEISGHYHPKIVLNASGRRLARRCFLSDGARLILPAFGAYAGGLDIADPAFDPLFPDGATAYFAAGARFCAAPRG